MSYQTGGACRSDPFGIPACFYWTVDEVADWVESIGYGKYKENFRSHFINGRRLLTVDACFLPKIGIVHFGDILTLARCVKNVLGKGPKVASLCRSRFPHGFYCPQPPYPEPECVCDWTCYLHDFYHGYQPKDKPVGVNEFDGRWWYANCGHQYRPFPRCMP